MAYYQKPIVSMFLGYPGSGKSYFAKNIADRLNAVRINGDSMRMAMFGSLEEMNRIYASKDRRILNTYVFNGLDYVAEQILMRGQDVIYDAHQNKRKDRETVGKLAERQGAVPIVISTKTPYDVALNRTMTREATVDQRQWDEDTARQSMDRHMANSETPVESEHVIEIDGQLLFEEQFQVFEARLLEILHGR